MLWIHMFSLALCPVLLFQVRIKVLLDNNVLIQAILLVTGLLQFLSDAGRCGSDEHYLNTYSSVWHAAGVENGKKS